MTIRIIPLTAATATASALAVAVAADRLDAIVAFVVLVGIALILSQIGTRKVALRLVLWTLPLLAPLLIIHGILNGSYPIDHRLFGILPYRSAGLAYASLVAMRMMLISIVGGYWLSVSHEDLVESLMRRRLPSSLIVLLVQGVGMASIISRRLDNVYLAQRARGMPVSGSALDRLRALPSVLVPVVIGTFVEADGRVAPLVSLGFGSLRVRSKPAPRLALYELLFLLLAPLAALAALAIDKS